MGNLLQGLITYLDILEHAAQNSEEDSDTRAAARNLSREATLVNLQVSQLTRIKENLRDAIYPVNVVPFIEEAVESAKQIIGEDNFSVEFNRPGTYSVIADGFLPLVFQSLFSFHAKRKSEDTIKFTITLTSERQQQIISIVSYGKEIPIDLRKFIESKQDIEGIALDLNLFTAKLLLSRYNAIVQCDRNEVTSENSCTLIFPSN
ncbi:MAG: HAMP domain-containing histidine kinase [Candidatus Thorarchaeota archaeon]|nr:HAMP domain-containing histidine kinase [Candidatus Thorarchaeota archaeon]